jgi:hypothetical protein
MQKVKIKYKRCIQNMQELGSDDDYMFSKIFLSLVYPDSKTENIEVEIKQTAGSDFEKDSIEIILPKDKIIILNYEQFRDSVENYYRKIIGNKGRGIRIENSSNIKMYNNIFTIPFEDEIDYSDEHHSGW